MAEANVLAVKMECAALFPIGPLRGVRTEVILAVDGNVLDRRKAPKPINPTVKQ